MIARVARGAWLAYGAIANISGSFFANGVTATGARCLYFSFWR